MSSNNKNNNEILQIVILCIAWYIISSTNNVVSKIVLSQLPYPASVTMIQLLSITIFSGPLLSYWNIRPYSRSTLTWRYYLTLIVPLAFGKFLTSVFSHISIWKVPVSYAHTVKATMPFFTVILARVITGEKQTVKVYCSLIPIITGVGIATVTELSYDGVGMICALISTAGFSLQHIYSKKVLQDTGIHHLRLLYLLGRLSFFFFIPVWAIIDLPNLVANPKVFTESMDSFGLMFLDGFLCWLQNIVAFSVISLVAPLTYAVANASKRIFIIAVSLFILGNPVTTMNVVGMFLAIIGVLCYNKAKYDQKQEQSKKPVLPMTQNNIENKHPLLKSFNMSKSEYGNGSLKNGYHLLAPSETSSIHLTNGVTRNHSKLLFV